MSACFILTVKIIYKFMGPKRSNFFTDFRLRFTQPGALNDSFECLPALDPSCRAAQSGQWIDKMLKDSSVRINNQNLPALFAAVRETRANAPEDFCLAAAQALNGLFGILSLAESPRNQLMWAHYSQDHTGFAIGFDPSHSFFQNSGEPGEVPPLTRVSYSDTRLLYDIDSPPSLWSYVFTKSRDWKYENEWRLVRGIRDHEAQAEPDERGYAVHCFPIPKDSVREVIFGVRASEALRSEVIARAKASNLRINIRQARLSATKFAVDIT